MGKVRQSGPLPGGGRWHFAELKGQAKGLEEHRRGSGWGPSGHGQGAAVSCSGPAGQELELCQGRDNTGCVRRHRGTRRLFSCPAAHGTVMLVVGTSLCSCFQPQGSLFTTSQSLGGEFNIPSLKTMLAISSLCLGTHRGQGLGLTHLRVPQCRAQAVSAAGC